MDSTPPTAPRCADVTSCLAFGGTDAAQVPALAPRAAFARAHVAAFARAHTAAGSLGRARFNHFDHANVRLDAVWDALGRVDSLDHEPTVTAPAAAREAGSR